MFVEFAPISEHEVVPDNVVSYPLWQLIQLCFNVMSELLSLLAQLAPNLG
jgi:hypothetical protein